MDFDTLLQKKVGEFGRYQILLFVIISYMAIPEGYFDLSIVFVAGLPDHWCDIPQMRDYLNFSIAVIKNLTIPMETRLDGTQFRSNCRMYNLNWTDNDGIGHRDHLAVVECKHGWHYDRSLYNSTIVTEWDLVCDKQPWVASVEAAYYAGGVFGPIVIGFISDKFGRSKVLRCMLIMSAITTIATPFSSTVVIFATMRLLKSMNSAYEVAFIMVMECVGPSWRTFCSLMYTVSYGLGLASSVLMGFLVRDWKILYYVMALCLTPSMIGIWFIPESPRWLYTKKRQHEADQIIRMIARRNRNPIMSTNTLNVVMQDSEDLSLRVTIQMYFHNRLLRKWALVLLTNWFIVGMVYVGLMLNISEIAAGDTYLNNLIAVLVEIPAGILSCITMQRYGRRPSLLCAEVVGGLSLLPVAWLPINLSSSIGVAMAAFGKLSMSAAYSILYLHTTEIFPTSLRGTSLGLCVTSFSVGGVLGPYIGDVGTYTGYKPLPVFIFGGLSIFAGLLALLLPETRGKPLSETVEDAANLGKNPKSKTLGETKKKKVPTATLR